VTRATFVLACVALAGCGAISALPIDRDGSVPIDGAAPHTDLGTRVDGGLPPLDLGRDAFAPLDGGPPPLDLSLPDGAPPDLGIDSGPPCDTTIADPLRALRTELACTGPPDTGNLCPTAMGSVGTTATIGGDPGATYDITLRVRGVIEERTYLGGTTTGFWNEGGRMPMTTDGYNSWSLTTSAPMQQFWLNAGMSGRAPYSQLLDEMHVVRVNGGATFTLTGDPLNGREYDNRDGSGAHVVVPDVPPAPDWFNGELVQLDVVSVACVTR